MTAQVGRRLYAALLLSSAGTLVLMGLALSLLMIGSVIGPFRLFATDPGFASQGLGLWLAPSADTAEPSERERRLAAWRNAVSGMTKLAESRSLSAFADLDVRVVTVSDARTLSEPERRMLESFLTSGGSVILTGAIGVQDGQGRPLGTGSMERLLRVARVTLAPRGEAPALASTRRGPLAAALAPGQQLALAPDPLLPGIEDPRAELVWLDETNPGAPVAASRRLDLGAGRLLWLAAGPAEIAGSGRDAAGDDAHRLFAAAYAWAAREPFAEVLNSTPGLAAAELDPAAWRELRKRVAVRVERTGPHRSLVEVTNLDAAPRAGLLLRVHLNTPAKGVEVGRTTLQQEEPMPTFDRATNQVDLRLPELAARSSRAFTLDIEPLSAGAPAARAQD